jgi:hypothetical protein
MSLDYDDYKVGESPQRPQKPVLKKTGVPKKSGVSMRMSEEKDSTPEDYHRYADELEEWNKDMVAYYAKSEKCRQKQFLLNEKFKEDVLAEFGLTGHPKADKVYAMAWEHGHANGLSEVEYWVGELVELVKD